MKTHFRLAKNSSIRKDNGRVKAARKRTFFLKVPTRDRAWIGATSSGLQMLIRAKRGLDARSSCDRHYDEENQLRTV